MRRGFGFLSRALIWVGAVSLAVAILLGRSERHPPMHGAVSAREPVPPRHRAFDGNMFRGDRRTARILDTETGQLGILKLSGAGIFDKLCLSPWRDADGQYHVIGRWQEDAKNPDPELPGPTGLVRWTYPEGRLLDRIPTDLAPLSPPCWFPDRSDRVLFAGADGRLYLVDFRETGSREGEMTGPRPRPILWEKPPAGMVVLLIREPCWPTDASLGGCLLVALSWRERDSDPRQESRSELWWLRLSPSATEIVAAGRLIVPGDHGAAPGDEAEAEFAPSVGTTSGGVAMLAYLTGPRGEGPRELRMAPMTLGDASTCGAPRVGAGTGRRLAAANVPLAPAFSPDGRWIYAAVQSHEGNGIIIKRIPVAPDSPHAPLSASLPTPLPGGSG